MNAWPATVAEAREIQAAMRCRVVCRDRLNHVLLAAGADVGFEDQGRITRAAVAVLRLPSLKLVESSVARCETCFPYVPGYLSFREAPAVIAAFSRLKQKPDLLLCDGQGIAHPRRFGLACHLGLLLDLPTIGVAKTRLVGEYREPGENKGSRSPLFDHGEQIGVVLRTRGRVKPVFVSCGHRISLSTAVDYVEKCVTRYRLPETTRWAHRLASG